jgi:hypothetical protein
MAVLQAAAAVSTIVSLPFTIRPVILKSRPKSKLKKWNMRIEKISATIASSRDMIMPEEMEKFLAGLQL